MEQNLDEFKKHINILSKDLSFYEDYEKGIIFPLNTIHLLCRLDYLELDKKEYEIAIFQKQIDELEYNRINVKKAVPKNEITGKDEDKKTITQKEVVCSQIWNVVNTLGVKKSFNNKEEALVYIKKINDEIKEYIV